MDDCRPSATALSSDDEAEEIPNGPLIQRRPAPSPMTWKIELLGRPCRVVILETVPSRTRIRPPPRVPIQSVFPASGKIDQIRSWLSRAKAGSDTNLFL